MQQHTGEHILSGILHQMFGAENVGFHIGCEVVRMDTSVPICPEGCRQPSLPPTASCGRMCRCSSATPPGRSLPPLSTAPKKEIEGQVRIVTIPGADVCACCGTPHPHHRSGGANQNSGIRELQGRRAAERSVRRPCAGGGTAMRARQADIGRCSRPRPTRPLWRYTASTTSIPRSSLHTSACAPAVRCTCPAANRARADAIRTVPGLDPDGLHRLAVRLTEATTGLCAALTPPPKRAPATASRRQDGDVRALTKP